MRTEICQALKSCGMHQNELRRRLLKDRPGYDGLFTDTMLDLIKEGMLDREIDGTVFWRGNNNEKIVQTMQRLLRSEPHFQGAFIQQVIGETGCVSSQVERNIEAMVKAQAIGRIRYHADSSAGAILFHGTTNTKMEGWFRRG